MHLQKLSAFAKPNMLVLLLLMLATRFHHSGSAVSLPDASLAVFFLGGLWNGRLLWFAILTAMATLIDLVATTQMGISDFCISPAYAFLLPTYAVLWFSGKYCQQFDTLKWQHISIQLFFLLASTSLAFFISNGSFFLLSDKVADTSWNGYIQGIFNFYPDYLKYGVIYVAIISAIKLLIIQLSNISGHSALSK